jgi:hypothetical protein
MFFIIVILYLRGLPQRLHLKRDEANEVETAAVNRLEEELDSMVL